MSTDDKPTAFENPLEQHRGTKFADMTRKQKWIFVPKVVVCVCIFGIVFPNVQND